MLAPQNHVPPGPPLFVMKIIWGAMLFSSFTYYLVLSIRPAMSEGDADPERIIPFAALAFVAFIMSFIIPNFLYKMASGRLRRPLELSAVLSVFLPPFIIRLALAEVACVLGLLVAMTNGIEYYFPFWALGAFSILLAFPSETNMLAKAEKYVPRRRTEIP